ncbi:restriction endonuclease subunit S [Pseudomonas lalucatii]|nr:restriction endonuclease subunit S [Pseudomonas lalucatii]
MKAQDFSSLSRSTTVPSIRKGDVEEVVVLLPPSAEQTRIAQKLDKLLAQVDTLKARIDAIPALLKRFRQSVLAAAVSGRLTEQWRAQNSATTPDHDAEIWGSQAQANLRIGNSDTSGFGWREVSLGEVCSVATGKTPGRKLAEYWDGGNIPWLTSAVTGSEFCSEADQYVTELAVKDCLLKLFPPGTLLMAMYGEGKTRGQVTELKITASCNQACAAITVNEGLAKREFVKIRLQENYEEIRKQAAGGAQPNLNLNKVREIGISLPPLDEQTEIVRRVEQLFAFADQLESKVQTAQARIDLLTQSLLAKAFRGELVPQDPNDEPASVLLERIRAQRAAQPKARRGRKAAAAN